MAQMDKLYLTSKILVQLAHNVSIFVIDLGPHISSSKKKKKKRTQKKSLPSIFKMLGRHHQPRNTEETFSLSNSTFLLIRNGN